MRGTQKSGRVSFLSALIVGIMLAVSIPTKAGFLTIYGGPTYDPVTATGYNHPSIIVGSIAADGLGAADTVYNISGASKGIRGVRWDTTGSIIELGNLGTAGTGSTDVRVTAVSPSGLIVGGAVKYVSGISMGFRAVEWDASGIPTELAGFGTSNTGMATTAAMAINDSGVIVGAADKYVAGVYMGQRPARWDASGTPTELANLGTDNSGMTNGLAMSINGSNQAVGFVEKYTAGNLVSQSVAARWDSTGAITELGNLGGISPTGLGTSQATHINSGGTAAGWAFKFVANVSQGQRAVRWDASGSAATELDNLGTANSGTTSSNAISINSTGTIVGYAEKYDAGRDLGMRPVRWDASGTAATELGILSTDNSGKSNGAAADINDAGITVGDDQIYDASGADLGDHAVMWGADGVAIDLNTLIDPASGWTTLIAASSITNDNWITGYGSFDPDGPGPLPSYLRLYIMQVPEPASVSLVGIGFGVLTLLSRRWTNKERIR